ncbi:hypothetical protein [Vibrio panuliri]|uniref:SAM-dependent methyltransferase n=1 Tax=Vibrio panuliri TaxID=1381081 RepID=A0ABX3FFK1_9VIBR|nr:hypothetical protein [Vibrio panuliri]KAB1460870.1 hypothetical protein F7O85_00400 [Vibrio panuliri]OLQ91675.1 hypothetical protein BIY20_09740 [Vibrio panuliri]
MTLLNHRNSLGNRVELASRIRPCDLTELRALLLDEKGRLRPVPAKELESIPHDELQYFCHIYGLYSVPSIEFIEWLEFHIEDKEKCVEIAAGNGVYGRHLGVTMTDNYMQHPKNRAKFRNAIQAYDNDSIPLVQYGDDVIEEDGKEAVRLRKAETVLCAWATHRYQRTKHHLGGNMFGIDFEWIAKRKHVKKIILVGNITTHKNNPLMDYPHEEHELTGYLFSRSSYPQFDRVFIWNVADD